MPSPQLEKLLQQQKRELNEYHIEAPPILAALETGTLGSFSSIILTPTLSREAEKSSRAQVLPERLPDLDGIARHLYDLQLKLCEEGLGGSYAISLGAKSIGIFKPGDEEVCHRRRVGAQCARCAEFWYYSTPHSTLGIRFLWGGWEHRHGRAQAPAQKPAAVLGMVPARGRPGAGHRCDQLSRPAGVLLIGLSRPPIGEHQISLERTGGGDRRDRHRGPAARGGTPPVGGLSEGSCRMDPQCLDHPNPPPMEKQKWWGQDSGVADLQEKIDTASCGEE